MAYPSFAVIIVSQRTLGAVRRGSQASNRIAKRSDKGRR